MQVILRWFASMFSTAAESGAVQAGRQALASLIGYIMVWGLHIIQHAAPALAEEITLILVKSLETTRPTVLRAAGILLRELTGQDLNLDRLSQQTMAEFVGAASPQPDSALVRGILGAFAPSAELTPEQGLSNLSSLFDLHMSTSLQAWMIDLLGEALSLGRLRSLAQFHAAVDAALGFRRVGMLMWRGPIQSAITTPVVQYYNRLYHAALPSPQQLVTGWQREIFSDEEYIDGMRSHGYSYERAQALLNVHEKELALGDVAALHKRGTIDADTLARVLRHQGYSDTHAQLITTWLEGKQVETLYTEIASTARRLFKAGDLGEEEYRGLLAEAHWRADEIELALATDQLALREEKQLTVAQIESAFLHQVFDDQEARRRLRQQRYADDTIDVLFALQRRQLSSAQVVDLYARGRVPRPEAQARLERIGYSADDASGLLDLRTKTLSEGQILDALGRGLINVQDATQALLALGYSAEAVDIILAFQRKTLSAADIQGAIVRELITPEEGLGRLMAIGYSQPDAQLIVDLRFRRLTIGQTLDAYADGLLTRDDTIRDLERLGLTREDAVRVVTVFDLKAQAAATKRTAGRPPAPPSLPTAPAP